MSAHHRPSAQTHTHSHTHIAFYLCPCFDLCGCERIQSWMCSGFIAKANTTTLVLFDLIHVLPFSISALYFTLSLSLSCFFLTIPALLLSVTHLSSVPPQDHSFIQLFDDGNMEVVSMWVCCCLEERRAQQAPVHMS